LLINRVWLKIKKYFLDLPELDIGFQLTPQGVVGLARTNQKSGPLIFRSHFSAGIIEPSFHKRNIRHPEAVKEILAQGFQKLEGAPKNLAFLPPEMSLRVFVLAFSSLPSRKEEAEKIIFFAVRKQFPLLPQDVRFAYQIIPENGQMRVVGALARQAVIEEYEQVFDSLGCQVKLILPPTLGLLPLVKTQGKGLVVNVEPDYWGAFVFEAEKVVFYRQKPFSKEVITNGEKRWDSLLQEVETTSRFIKDKEKIELEQIILRNGVEGRKGDLANLLETKFGLRVTGIEDLVGGGLGSEEKVLGAPLMGVLEETLTNES